VVHIERTREHECMRILAVAHQDDADPGLLADVAASRGNELDQWHIHADTTPPAPVAEYGAVVLLGGRMHADDDHAHPWLSAERHLVRDCLASGRPLLGVCLGAQILAQVADGVVRNSQAPEIGWHEVTLTPEASTDELFACLPSRLRAFHWHVDEFQVPKGYAMLARSAICEQAFRAGEAAWGVQFHPEITQRTASKWITHRLPSLARVHSHRDVSRLHRETKANIGLWNHVGHRLIERFIAFAHSRA
jgi:GMP synthase (glutamine-hydrolysing)